MSSADQVRVYKPTGARNWAVPIAAGLVFSIVAIVMMANYREAGWSGVVLGAAIIPVWAALMAIVRASSVTVHEQGIVVRQHLRREFIPWQAVVAISPPETFAGASGPAPKGPGTLVTEVCVCVDTGVKYMEKWKRLDPTSGSPAHVEKIAAEMQEFRRRERESRIAAAADSPPSRLQPPVTPVPPASDGDDRDYGPPPGKALW
ncbi:MAG TPA: hypothetical protein VGG35_19390 [Streptosporangiaceae bacterium]|jgi:hypothetical protein